MDTLKIQKEDWADPIKAQQKIQKKIDKLLKDKNKLLKDKKKSIDKKEKAEIDEKIAKLQEPGYADKKIEDIEYTIKELLQYTPKQYILDYIG